MNTEIEAKLKVDSLEKIADRLKELGAEFIEEQRQVDSYFDYSGELLKESDRGLRLRQQQEGTKEKIILTYKGERAKNRFKRREEIEVEIGNAELIEKIILAIGFEKVVTVNKQRKIWCLDDCEIALDDVDMLGSFVEIEGPSEEVISKVQEKLGLADLPHIRESYSEMVSRY